MNPSTASGGTISKRVGAAEVEVDRTEQQPVDQRRDEHREAAAQRPVEEAAEEELLRERRHADDHEPGRDPARACSGPRPGPAPRSARRRAAGSPCRAPRARRSVTSPSAAQPTAGQKRVRRSPKCQRRGFRDERGEQKAVPMKITPWRKVATIVKVGFDVVGAGAERRRDDAHDDERQDQRHEEADARVPRRPARSAPSGSSGRSGGGGVGSMVTYSTAVRVGRRSSAKRANGLHPCRRRRPRAAREPRGPRPRGRPPRRCRPSRPRAAPPPARTPAIASARSKTRAVGFGAPDLGRGDHAVHQLDDARRAEPVRQRAVPVAGDHDGQAALAQLAERRQHVRVRPELERPEHRRARVAWSRSGSSSARRISSAQRSRRRSSALAVGPLEVVLEVVARSRPRSRPPRAPRSPRSRLARAAAEGAGPAAGARPGCRGRRAARL